jgi:hypothetical protein
MVPRDPKLPASNTCTEWDIEQDEERLYPRILSRNEYHFAQAEKTPLAGGSLGKELGNYGTSKAAQAVLRGEWKPEYPLKELQLFLAELKQPSSISPIHQDITDQDFHKEFRQVKEQTSSSTSGRHVGHYKAAAIDKNLSTAYAKLLSLPLRHGFSYDCWKLVTDVMLLKKANDIRLHIL